MLFCCNFDIEYVLFFDRNTIKKIYNQAWLKYFNNIFKAMLAAIFILIFFNENAIFYLNDKNMVFKCLLGIFLWE